MLAGLTPRRRRTRRGESPCPRTCRIAVVHPPTKSLDSRGRSVLSPPQLTTWRSAPTGYRLLLTVPDEEPSEHFASWAKVAEAVEELEQRVPPLDEHDTLYVRGMLHALHTFARVRDGTALSYLDQVRAYLELSDIWVDENELSPLRDRLRDLLAQLGLPTEVDPGLRMWEQRRRVPVDQVSAVATPLIAASHKVAIAHGIPLPSEVNVDLIVRSTPYYAYAHYYGGFRGSGRAVVRYRLDVRVNQAFYVPRGISRTSGIGVCA